MIAAPAPPSSAFARASANATSPPLRGGEDGQSINESHCFGNYQLFSALPASPQPANSRPMRTRLSICRKKRRFPSEAEAVAAAQAAAIRLRPYRCDRCHLYHLTGRTRGKRRLPVAG